MSIHPLSIHPLDISWAATANERRRLHWELLACEQVRGVLRTAREAGSVLSKADSSTPAPLGGTRHAAARSLARAHELQPRLEAAML